MALLTTFGMAEADRLRANIAQLAIIVAVCDALVSRNSLLPANVARRARFEAVVQCGPWIWLGSGTLEVTRRLFFVVQNSEMSD
eukprot:2809112-Rhodomonas_salina.1